MPEDIEQVRADVLVVGAGGAGLRAAIAAWEWNPRLDVLLAANGRVGSCGVTAIACSDRMAFHATLPTTEPGTEDAWKYHAEDVYRYGGYVSDGTLAAVQAREAAGAFDYLDKLGVPFVKKDDGTPDQFVTDGSKYARACYTGPTTAIDIEEALVRKLRETSVRVIENATMFMLVRGEGGGASGAFFIDESGKLLAVTAASVVLATGGPGKVFADNVYPGGMDGVAHAAAYETGAEFVNMEFIQVGLCNPATQLACSGSIMRAMAAFVRDDGGAFLGERLGEADAGKTCSLVFRKGATWPATFEEPSHAIDVAVALERRNGPVYLDFSRNPEEFSVEKLEPEVREWYAERGGGDGTVPAASPLERLALINEPVIEWLRERGVDLAGGDKLEVAPSAQHFQGGVKIGEDGRTNIKGLYACGECAGGQHGANRPGGNALMDAQVFGKMAGESAAEQSREAGEPAIPTGELNRAALLLESAAATPLESSSERLARVRETISRNALVVRTDKPMNEALQTLEEIDKEVPSGKAPRAERKRAAALGALKLRSAITCARMILNSAIARNESRGSHLKFASEDATEPLPRDDEHFRKYAVISRDGETMKLEMRQPKELPFQSKEKD